MKDAIQGAVELAKHFEGLRLTPYYCPAGVATQGWGTVHKPDGSVVKITDPPITEATATEWLTQTMQGICLAVLKESPALASSPNALAATLDFVYNLGIGRYRSSTLKKKINEQDYQAAADELLKWNKAGGVVLAGLVRRRKAERELMLL